MAMMNRILLRIELIVPVIALALPLHSSPAGLRYGRTSGSMGVTDDCSARLIRLPLWVGMPLDVPETVVERVRESVATVSARLRS